MLTKPDENSIEERAKKEKKKGIFMERRIYVNRRAATIRGRKVTDSPSTKTKEKTQTQRLGN